MSGKISVDDLAINFGQFLQITNRHALVDLMHRLTDQTELDHGAMMRDESSVRRAAGRRQCRLAAGDFGNGGGDQVGERARLGYENTGVRRLPLECEIDLSTSCLRGPLLDKLFERVERMVVIEPDIEACARLAWNEIDRLVADIDRCEF